MRRRLTGSRAPWLLTGLGVALCAPLAFAATQGPTELISIGPAAQNPVTDRGQVAVSADGRWVAFDTDGRDIDPLGLNTFSDVYAKDRNLPQGLGFERLSVPDGGGHANGASRTGRNSLSADGSKAVFWGTASNLVPSDNNLRSDVFLRDRSAGTTVMLSRNAAGLDANGNATDATISANGNVVAFTSDAPDLVAADTNGRADVFVRDVSGGTTTLVSATPGGAPGNGASGPAMVSADGTKVAFASTASDLVAGDTNGRSDVFVRDLAAGTTTRVSVSNAGGAQVTGGESVDPFISPDGRWVGFSSTAPGIAGNRGSSVNHDLYLRDTALGRTERLSFLPIGLENTSGTTRQGSISDDGRLVAFSSTSTAYRPGDGGNLDIFVIDRATDQVTRVSEQPNGGTANGSSDIPVLSGPGVGFRSSSNNMSTPGGQFNRQIFFRPFAADAVAADIDGDGVGNLDDLCPNDADNQTDTDADSRGDACDADDDGDGVRDTAEAAQNTDPLDPDTDGDGAGDLADDYPADSSRIQGTEHQGVNAARLDSADGSASVKIVWDPSDGKFDVYGTGRLIPRTNYKVNLYRRERTILHQSTVCSATAEASAGAWACSSANRAIKFFTHVEIIKSSAIVATAVCGDPPDTGAPERRCELLQ
ncbi:MAG TPA: thrombospondin type 3 repeat-containing protein [Thermoleophilaceae bacterium]|nr:thrombospondin type 3 repeat-containing protein [Thermoleophilaceae bacterium]